MTIKKIQKTAGRIPFDQLESKMQKGGSYQGNPLYINQAKAKAKAGGYGPIRPGQGQPQQLQPSAYNLLSGPQAQQQLIGLMKNNQRPGAVGAQPYQAKSKSFAGGAASKAGGMSMSGGYQAMSKAAASGFPAGGLSKAGGLYSGGGQQVAGARGAGMRPVPQYRPQQKFVMPCASPSCTFENAQVPVYWQDLETGKNFCYVCWSQEKTGLALSIEEMGQIGVDSFGDISGCVEYNKEIEKGFNTLPPPLKKVRL